MQLLYFDVNTSRCTLRVEEHEFQNQHVSLWWLTAPLPLVRHSFPVSSSLIAIRVCESAQPLLEWVEPLILLAATDTCVYPSRKGNNQLSHHVAFTSEAGSSRKKNSIGYIRWRTFTYKSRLHSKMVLYLCLLVFRTGARAVCGHCLQKAFTGEGTPA